MVSCSECHIFGLALFGIDVIMYLLNSIFLKDSIINKVHDLCSFLRA
jgi:hypothetical protein